MVFIINGSGQRITKAHEGEADVAPRLVVEFGNEGVQKTIDYHNQNLPLVSSHDPETTAVA